MPRRASSDNPGVDPRVVEWMQRAVALAAASQPHPNPRVGAVVLSPSGAEISAACHEGPGQPHAEVLALRAAGEAARGATIVTTLEPCSHHGRTPPCTDALIAAGVSRVVIGAGDPDGRVSGAGIVKLREAGIDVVTDVADREARAMDPGYFHHRATGRPRFRVKLAATLDGQVAARDGTSQWITSPEARADAHRLRAAADAVMVGAGTLRADDPRLDVRLSDFAGRQPRPVVIAGKEVLPTAANALARGALVYSPHPLELAPPAEVVVTAGPAGADLHAVAKDLASRGILEVLVEGGSTLAAGLIAVGLADAYTFYFGAVVAGGSGMAMFNSAFTSLRMATRMEIHDVVRLGPDMRVDAAPVVEEG